MVIFSFLFHDASCFNGNSFDEGVGNSLNVYQRYLLDDDIEANEAKLLRWRNTWKHFVGTLPKSICDTLKFAGEHKLFPSIQIHVSRILFLLVCRKSLKDHFRTKWSIELDALDHMTYQQYVAWKSNYCTHVISFWDI